MSLTYAAQHSDNSARKSSAIVAVVLLHMGLFYAFTHGLNVVNVVKPFKDTVAVFIPLETPPKTPPPPPEIKPAEVPIDTLVSQTPDPVPVEIPVEVPVQVDSGPSAISTAPESSPTEVTRSFSITHKVNPTYPAASRRAGETGTVLLNIIVGPNGVPTEVSVERSSGFAALDQAAMAAVRMWRFTVKSESSYSRLQLPMTFRLENG